ncbi:MAG: hypothetical protein PHQ95_00790 [Candidatus Gracilibacteria bacterium]|nr:hypothetical protein [Candidatus Gracilibacteria bacterium]
MSEKKIITNIGDVHFGPEGMDPTCPYMREKIQVEIHPFSGKGLETTVRMFFKTPIPETAYEMQIFAKSLGRPLEYEELYLFSKIAPGFDGSDFDITAFSQGGFRRFRLNPVVDGLWEYASLVGIDRNVEKAVSDAYRSGCPFEAPETSISMYQLITNIVSYRNKHAKGAKMKSETEFVKFVADMIRLEAFAPLTIYVTDWKYGELHFSVSEIMEKVRVFQPVRIPDEIPKIFPIMDSSFTMLQVLRLLQQDKYDGIAYISNDQSSQKFAGTLKDYSRTSGLIFKHIRLPEEMLDLDLNKKMIYFIAEKIAPKLTKVCCFPNSCVFPITVRDDD